MKILLVEDEKDLGTVLRRALLHVGFTVDLIDDGEKAFRRISTHHADYDLIILDLNLPHMEGSEICTQSRARGVVTPILILTAHSAVETRVKLLTSGADDYLIKPFSYSELIARVHALLRRPKTSLPQKLVAGDIVLDPGTREVTLHEKDLVLTLKEFSLLEYFMRHPGQVVNRDDLLSHIWDFNYAGFSNVVDVHMKNLRKKIESPHVPNILETVRGVGYRLRE